MRRSAFIILAIILTTSCYAQPKNGNGANKNLLWQKNGISICDSQGRSTKQNSRIVSLDDGATIIVWEDSRNGYIDIFAQKLDASGAKLWGEGGIAVCKAPFNQTFPQIMNAGKNQVIVTWQDYRGESSDIYAQKINVEGRSMWQKDGVPVSKAPSNQMAPQLASDGAGGAIITWYDYRSGRGEDIYAQKINSAGSIEWDPNGIVVCSAEGTQWYPQVVSDGQGGAVICWDDKRGEYYDIYVQRLDQSGNAAWPQNGIAVCQAPENQEYSQIASCEQGSFVLVWQDYRNGNADIYSQNIDLSGKMLWKTNGTPVCSVLGNQERPQIVGGSNPLIVWVDYRNGTGNSDIFCQKLSATGELLWDKYGNPVCEAQGNQQNPKAASDNDGGAVIVWQDLRGSNSAIFARHVKNDGKVLWFADGKTICNVKDTADFPQIAVNKYGNSIIVWQDKRYGGPDLFSQSIDLLGSNMWKNNGIEVAAVFGSVSQQKPKLIKSGNGEYIVAFEDYRNGYSNIYVQKFNNKGVLLWDREGLRVCSSQGNQLKPELIQDDEGGAIIVWEDLRDNISDIYAQRIDLYGDLLWDENGILICQSDKDKKNPKITKDMKGGAIIAWLDHRNNPVMPDIYSQRVDKNGSLVWGPGGIAINKNEGIQTNIKIDSDGEGGCIVTWVDYKKNINTPDIYAQRIDPAGKQLWEIAGLAVCKAPEAQRNQDLEAGGDIIIVWEDSGSGNYDIYAQKINNDGTIAWACDGVPVCTVSYTQQGPKVVKDGAGGAIITWEDYRTANWDIFSQRIDASGNLLWAKDGLEICSAGGTQYSPKVVKGKGLSSIIVWEDYRNNKSYNIYAQQVSGSGEVTWEKDGVAICSSSGGARNPEVVDDGEGGAIIVWADFRYGTYDIYAQRINEAGSK